MYSFVLHVGRERDNRVKNGTGIYGSRGRNARGEDVDEMWKDIMKYENIKRYRGVKRCEGFSRARI